MAISSPTVVQSSAGSGVSKGLEALLQGVMAGRQLEMQGRQLAEAQRQFDIQQSSETMWKMVEAIAPNYPGGARGVLEAMKPAVAQSLSLMPGMNDTTTNAFLDDLFNADLGERDLMQAMVMAQMDYRNIVSGPTGIAKQYGAGKEPSQRNLLGEPQAAPATQNVTAQAPQVLEAPEPEVDIEETGKRPATLTPKVLATEEPEIDIQEPPAPLSTELERITSSNPHVKTEARKSEISEALMNVLDSVAVQDYSNPRSMQVAVRSADQARRLAQAGMSTREKMRAAVDYYSDNANRQKVYSNLGNGDVKAGEKLFWDMYNAQNQAYIQRIKSEGDVSIATLEAELKGRELDILEKAAAEGGAQSEAMLKLWATIEKANIETASRREVAEISAESARETTAMQAAQRAQESLDDTLSKLYADFSKIDPRRDPSTYIALGEEIARIRSLQTGVPYKFFVELYNDTIWAGALGRRAGIKKGEIRPVTGADIGADVGPARPRREETSTTEDAADQFLGR